MKRTAEQQKGNFYYMSYQTKVEIMKTISFFAIALAVFLIGYISTGTKKNLLTIIAILILLPSSKSLVNMIMFLKAPKFSEDIYKRISSLNKDIKCIYALILTAYEGTYPVDCITVKGPNLIVYSSHKQIKTSACENHIQSMLKKDNYHNMTVKVFTDESKFCNRCEQLKELENNGNEEKILQLMCDISL